MNLQWRRKTQEEDDILQSHQQNIFNSGAILVQQTVPPPQEPWDEGLTRPSSPLSTVTGVSTESVPSWTFEKQSHLCPALSVHAH